MPKSTSSEYGLAGYGVTVRVSIRVRVGKLLSENPVGVGARAVLRLPSRKLSRNNNYALGFGLGLGLGLGLDLQFRVRVRVSLTVAIRFRVVSLVLGGSEYVTLVGLAGVG